MRLIDADALVALINKRLKNPAIIGWLCRIISEVPTIEAEPVRHGRWVHAKTYYESDECNCSLCGQLMTTKIGKRMNYCPNCGAKMQNARVDDGT